MLSKTIEIDGVKATVHQETGRHVVLKRILLQKVSVDHDGEWEFWWDFARVLSQSTDVETPFLWPEVTDSLDELTKARDAFLALPGHVYREWVNALNEVDAPPQSVELTPAATEKNA